MTTCWHLDRLRQLGDNWGSVLSSHLSAAHQVCMFIGHEGVCPVLFPPPPRGILSVLNFFLCSHCVLWGWGGVGWRTDMVPVNVTWEKFKQWAKPSGKPRMKVCSQRRGWECFLHTDCFIWIHLLTEKMAGWKNRSKKNTWWKLNALWFADFSPTWFEKQYLLKKVIKHSSASSMKSNQIKPGKGPVNRI